MPNHRMLAVAALIVLSVPALGAAAPYLPVVVSTPTPETLVEGHTVFTVIEVNRTSEVNGTTRFAAAVAVLVREYSQENRAVRFPGVLWFNDQYLVNPQSQAQGGEKYRYPCGGAVMAVNRGDPDPRVVLLNADLDTQATSYGSPSGNYTTFNVTADTTGATPYANVSSDGFWWATTTGVGTTNTYVESYSIVDPNDHTWVIDRYNGYYRTSVSPDGVSRGYSVYQFPVWVVNILGGTTFIPDDGEVSCSPFYDQLEAAYQTMEDAFNTYPSDTGPNNLPTYKDTACDGNDWPPQPGGRDIDPHHYPTVQDDPCAGYANPGSNGYCYGGQSATGGGCSTPAKPLRLYNALLYFNLKDLRVAGANRDHAATSTDTNGCQSGTLEWDCPAGDDNAEGNSHPFHPTTGVHTHAGTPCYATGGGYQPNAPTNHGGSTTAVYNPTTGTYGPASCDLMHATRDIDIYFSPTGRPMRPATQPGATDTDGSNAPFHDHHTAYP